MPARKNLSPDANNFGARLRELIANKGENIVDFARNYGLSEAQLHNWLKREAPPLPKHWDKLAQYFRRSRDYIAFGALDKVESMPPPPASPLHAVGVEEAQGAEAEVVAAEIRTDLERAIAAAGGNVARLHWLHEQVLQHVSPPARWARGEPEPARKPLTGIYVPPAKEQTQSPRHGSASA